MLKTIIDRAARAMPFTPDDRGLMPLAKARAFLKKHPTYEPSPVKDLPEFKKEWDRASQHWAALLSLADAAELEEALFATAWNQTASPYAGQLLVDRYGIEPMMRFFAGSIDFAGMFCAPFLDTLDILRAQGTEEAFDLMLRVCNTFYLLSFQATRGVKVEALPPPKYTPVEPINQWLLEFAKAHPAEARSVLDRRVKAKDKRAKQVLALVDPKPVKALTPAALEKAILASLDKVADEHTPDWPRFDTKIEDDPSTYEYFELRMVAVASKTTQDWGIAFERLSGSYDKYEVTRVQRHLFGSKIKDPGWDSGRDIRAKFKLSANCQTLTGPKGPLTLDPKKLAKRDLKHGLGCELEGDADYNHRLRAYVDAFPGAFFASAEDLVALLGVPDPIVLCDTTAFAHAPAKPGKSPVYKSIAKAIVTRDKKAVKLGKSNLDFREHAKHRLQ